MSAMVVLAVMTGNIIGTLRVMTVSHYTAGLFILQIAYFGPLPLAKTWASLLAISKVSRVFIHSSTIVPPSLTVGPSLCSPSNLELPHCSFV